MVIGVDRDLERHGQQLAHCALVLIELVQSHLRELLEELPFLAQVFRMPPNPLLGLLHKVGVAINYGVGG